MKDLFFINDEIRGYDTIIIYGARPSGRNVLLKLLQRDIKVKCFADYDPTKYGTALLNIPVVHIDELKEMREAAAIIVSGRYMLENAAELGKRGWMHIFLDYGNEDDIIHLEREDA